MRRKREFSIAAGEVSVSESFRASHPMMTKDMRANPPVSPGTPSEKFTLLKNEDIPENRYDEWNIVDTDLESLAI
jgi:hypothetical protein